MPPHDWSENDPEFDPTTPPTPPRPLVGETQRRIVASLERVLGAESRAIPPGDAVDREFWHLWRQELEKIGRAVGILDPSDPAKPGSPPSR
jgi:hypothetical protein